MKKLNTSVVEPNIDQKSFKHLNLTNTKNAIKKSDIVVILVNHKEFKNLKIFNKNNTKTEILDISGLHNSLK